MGTAVATNETGPNEVEGQGNPNHPSEEPVEVKVPLMILRFAVSSEKPHSGITEAASTAALRAWSLQLLPHHKSLFVEEEEEEDHKVVVVALVEMELFVYCRRLQPGRRVVQIKQLIRREESGGH